MVFVSESDDDGLPRGVDANLPHLAHERAGRSVEALALAGIHVRPDRVAVAARELRVGKEQPLHEVVAGGELLERRDGEAGHGRVDGDRLARRERIDVDAEERLAAVR